MSLGTSCMSSRSIHVMACVRLFLLPKAGWYSTVCPPLCSFTHRRVGTESLPRFGCCEKCFYERECTDIFLSSEELIFKFHLISVNVNVMGRMWEVVTAVDDSLSAELLWVTNAHLSCFEEEEKGVGGNLASLGQVCCPINLVDCPLSCTEAMRKAGGGDHCGGPGTATRGGNPLLSWTAIPPESPKPQPSGPSSFYWMKCLQLLHH